MQTILSDYTRASGHIINFNNFEILFSTNTSVDSYEILKNIMGVSECLGTGKYLGLPSMIGRRKKVMCGVFLP